MTDKNDSTPGVQASCKDSAEPGLLDPEQARARILALATPLPGSEYLELRQALGRTLAEDVVSGIDVPSHTNSAMDGYALRACDIAATGASEFAVVGSAFAGRPFDGTVDAGQCVRIMTGATMPDNTDTVVIQERCNVTDTGIRIDSHLRQGENVRRAGEDLARGAVALAAGTHLGAAELGLLASMGVGEVRVRRRLRVAFFSTGDELRPVGARLEEGEIYDSNRYTLHGMLQRIDADIIDMGVICDRPQALRQAFVQAAAAADVVITSGGVSVGEADHVKAIVAELGQVDFWKLAIKPGRPLACGRLGNTLFFGLPGNPVAVMVTFYQFVQPALRNMLGATHSVAARFQVPCLSEVKKRPGRTEYLRGCLQRGEDGMLRVALSGAQGSGILRSMSHADCFIVLPPECAGVTPGDPVEVEPFHGLM